MRCRARITLYHLIKGIEAQSKNKTVPSDQRVGVDMMLSQEGLKARSCLWVHESGNWSRGDRQSAARERTCCLLYISLLICSINNALQCSVIMGQAIDNTFAFYSKHSFFASTAMFVLGSCYNRTHLLN